MLMNLQPIISGMNIMQPESLSPFNLPSHGKLRWLASAGESMLGLDVLDHYYRQKTEDLDTNQFIRYTLETLGINYTVVSGSLDNIPASGPAIVVANHPFGAIEGVILAELLLRLRSDVKVLANYFLQRIPELRDLFIGVDVFEGDTAIRSNIAPVKQAINHVRNGGLLLMFPAGEVSSFRLPSTQITDKEWNRIIGMMVRKTRAQVTPVYIEGGNSKLFHFAGMIHTRFRTLMLVREMLKKQDQTINLHIGNTITQGELNGLDNDAAITQYLRLNTYLMADRCKPKKTLHSPASSSLPIAETIPPETLFDNVMSLSTRKLLLQSGDFDIYCAAAEELPAVLNEIGRLREISFRAVGEGTGQARDLDKYDAYYLHLFIWDRTARCIVGAYRLGLAGQIIAAHGLKGLYSRSLFGFNKNFINGLGQSIEMGRSFIRPEYQRNKNALLLLWKGIAAYIYRNPQYTTLFGPVSISNDYSETSRALMTSFLVHHHYDDIRAGEVKPTNPQKKPRNVFWTQEMISMLSDNKVISKLVERMEGDKGLPILIKQYLGLNGRLVSFNVDKDFNDALDGLIIVDLLKVPEKVLARYMGKDQAAAFLARHLPANSALCSQVHE